MMNSEIIDMAIELNILMLQAYIVSALLLAILAIITNPKKLRNISMGKQILFFILQPILWLKEMRR